MSAVTPLADSAARRGSVDEPASGWVLTCVLAGLLVTALLLQREVLSAELQSKWAELVFWTVLILLVNLLPLNLGEITLTLDMPILLAVAFLYPPPVAAAVSVIAAMDVREIYGRVPLVRAFFNRVQVGLCVLSASAVYHALSDSAQPSIQAAFGTTLAILAFHSVNVLLVTSYTYLRIGAWNRLSVGNVGQFFLTYLGYGALALVLAHLFADVGAWSVVTLLTPIVVAREALVRAQRLQALANVLRQRERLLERLFGRIVDERKDERGRIAAELHDDVLQSLVRISQLGQFLRQETAGDTPAHRDATEVAAVSGQAIRELRQVVSDLRSSPLGRAGLLPTLRSLCRDLQLDWRTNIALEAPPALEIAGEQQLALYQVAKEAMINALRHADPNKICVRLSEDDKRVFLEVEDDGRGFSPERVGAPENFGLGLIQERVGQLKGKVEIRSETGSGTSLSVLLPKEVEPDPSRSAAAVKMSRRARGRRQRTAMQQASREPLQFE